MNRRAAEFAHGKLATEGLSETPNLPRLASEGGYILGMRLEDESTPDNIKQVGFVHPFDVGEGECPPLELWLQCRRDGQERRELFCCSCAPGRCGPRRSSGGWRAPGALTKRLQLESDQPGMPPIAIEPA